MADPGRESELDFWDLTVVIFRRWKVSLPLFLIAIAAGAFVLLTAKPDFKMTSYVQLIPAKVTPTDNPTAASLRNPWNQLGLNTLGQASIYATQDQKFLDALKASKHTDNLTLTMTYPNPIVTVEVVGTSQADARETTQLVIDQLRASSESLQKGAGVVDGDLITMQRLDQGQNVAPSLSKLKRAVFAVAAAGLVLTTGGTLGFDALLRRRSRRRKEKEKAGSPSPATPEVPSTNGKEAPASAKVHIVEPGEPGARPATVVPEEPADVPVSPAPAPPSGSRERTAIVVRRSASVVKPSSAATPVRPPAATYQSANAQSKADGDSSDASSSAVNGDSAAAASDVRVVLQPKRLGGENGRKAT